MNATYTKLNSGEWGIRVIGTVEVGQAVTVTKKSGETKTEKVKKVLWTGTDRDSGSPLHLCVVEPFAATSYTPQAGRNGSDRGTMTGQCWECGAAMPQWKADRGDECGYC